MPVRRFVAGICLAAVLIGSACGDIIDPSDNKIEDFSGTLAVGGSNGHEFSVSKNGEFEIKITALSPNADAVIGVAYGQFQGSQCLTLQSNPFGQINRVVLAGFINSGRYCVSVFDLAGTISQPENYTIRVSHP
jgi:hypothetical protein